MAEATTKFSHVKADPSEKQKDVQIFHHDIDNFPEMTCEKSPKHQKHGVEWFYVAYVDEVHGTKVWVSAISFRPLEPPGFSSFIVKMFIEGHEDELVLAARSTPMEMRGRAVLHFVRLHWERTLATHVFGDSVRVRLEIEFYQPIPLPKWDFSMANDSLMTDVVLVADDREFHVSKAVLACFSTYFKAMFFENFRESTDPKVKLESVDGASFQVLLEVLYHKNDIDGSNAEELLALAEYFDMTDIRNRCERALMIDASDARWEERVRIADEYNLKDLLKYSIRKLGPLKTAQDFTVENVRRFKPETVRLLMYRIECLNVEEEYARHEPTFGIPRLGHK